MDQLLENWLADHSIEYVLHRHPYVYTVEEARLHCSHIPGLHCKNLFLKDSVAKKFYLITLPATKKVEIKLLRKIIGAKKLSFAKADELKRILNLDPGSVSPFGLVNDKLNKVIYCIDKEVWKAEKVCFHPNTNDETLELNKIDFQTAIIGMTNKYHLFSPD
jgi:Ala-tRNA(Pro) deacylase